MGVELLHDVSTYRVVPDINKSLSVEGRGLGIVDGADFSDVNKLIEGVLKVPRSAVRYPNTSRGIGTSLRIYHREVKLPNFGSDKESAVFVGYAEYWGSVIGRPGQPLPNGIIFKESARRFELEEFERAAKVLFEFDRSFAEARERRSFPPAVCAVIGAGIAGGVTAMTGDVMWTTGAAALGGAGSWAVEKYLQGNDQFAVIDDEVRRPDEYYANDFARKRVERIASHIHTTHFLDKAYSKLVGMGVAIKPRELLEFWTAADGKVNQLITQHNKQGGGVGIDDKTMLDTVVNHIAASRNPRV